jgi:23S rRNA pseudouridine2457 synthase
VGLFILASLAMYSYYVIYKPYLTLSQFSSDGSNKQTLAHFFHVPKDVYPVGRLDYDSEGLLILTNDKQLNHRLLHPSHAHQRTYYVQVDGAITKQALEKLSKGVTINIDVKPYTTQPCNASLLHEAPNLPPRNPPIRFRKKIPAPWISLTLTEGKNRQVRRMTAHVGFPTLRLVRYSIEQLTITNMQSGELKQFTKQEIYQLLFHE